MTQRDRVLAALRHAGPTGLTQVDFLSPQVCDKGKPITRLAARVGELRDEGLTIDSSGTRHGCAIYVLREQPVSSESVSPAGQSLATATGSDETSTLFDPVELHQPTPHWQEEAA